MDDASAPPSASLSARTRFRIVVACGLGSFMAALSTNLVNISAPTMARDLGLSTAQVSQVVTVYLLLVTVLLPFSGRAGDAIGQKKVFVTGFAAFGISALFCAAARDLVPLVVARGFQGAAASMLMAMGPAIVVRAFPPSHRARAIGLQLSLTYLGLVLGPTLGGAIVVAASWRGIFVLLAAVATAGTLLGALWLPSDATQKSDEGKSPRPPHGSPPASRGLASKSLTLGLAGALLLYTTTVMISFSLPFQLEHGRGFSPRDAGLLMTSQPAVMFIVAPASGWLADRFGTRAPCTAGMFAIASGCFLLTRATEISAAALVAALGLVGLGAGMFVAPNNASIMSAAPKQRQGTAAAAGAMARNIGMTCGVALAAALLQRTGEHRTVMMTGAALAVVGLIVALIPRADSPTASRFPGTTSR